MSGIRLIATDMDHTLLTERGEMPPGIRDCIRELTDAGIVFVASSGRPLATLRTMFPPQGHGVGYIADNGGIVALGDDVLFESLLPPEDYQPMISLTLEETPAVPVLCGVDAAYVLAAHREHEDYLRTFYARLEFVDRFDGFAPDADKFTAYFPDGNSRQYYERLYEPAYGAGFSVTVGGPVWVDIMNSGIHKGSGMLTLASRLGIGPDQMMAFGDTDNDVEMLEAVHHSYAVANADEKVRRLARFTAPSNDEFGVVQVIRQVLDGSYPH